MVTDQNATVLVRVKKRVWTFFVHKFAWLHWYYEGDKTYHLVELQLLWFLFTYEKES